MKILANGEIVNDDDPRASSLTRENVDNKKNRRPQQITETRSEDHPNLVAHGPTVSLFDTLNNQLLSLGVPSWNLGPYIVKPIVSAGFLLSLILMGFRGLLFSGILFFVVNYSQSSNARFPFPDLSRFGFGSRRHNSRIGNATSNGVINGLNQSSSERQNNSDKTKHKNKFFTGQGQRLS